MVGTFGITGPNNQRSKNFPLQIHYALEVIAENVPISRHTNLDFYVFSKQPHPQCHILIFAPGEKIGSNLKEELYKLCLKGQVQSVESENVKMGTSAYN